jgi:hypothetical protein
LDDADAPDVSTMYHSDHHNGRQPALSEMPLSGIVEMSGAVAVDRLQKHDERRGNPRRSD